MFKQDKIKKNQNFFISKEANTMFSHVTSQVASFGKNQVIALPITGSAVEFHTHTRHCSPPPHAKIKIPKKWMIVNFLFFFLLLIWYLNPHNMLRRLQTQILNSYKRKNSKERDRKPNVVIYPACRKKKLKNKNKTMRGCQIGLKTLSWDLPFDR